MCSKMRWVGFLLVLTAGGAAYGDLPGYHLAYQVNGPADGGGSFGFSLAKIADVSGDGRPDLVVGAPGAGDTNYGNVSGAVFLLQMTQSGCTVLSRIDDTSGNSKLGFSVAALPDINGDGIPDYAAGASFGGYVIWASGADRTVGGDVNSHPGVIAKTYGGADVHYFGTSLAGLNTGVLVEASRPDVGGVGTNAQLYPPPVTTGMQPQLKIDARYSWRNDPAVLNVGDQVGNDGIDDYLLANDNSSTSAGRVSLVSGATAETGTALLSDIETTHFDGPAPETLIGDMGYGYHPMATAGDFNGDGVTDYVFTAGRSYNWTGAAYFYDGATQQMLWELPRPAGVDRVWDSVADVGDIDGDHKDDIAIMMAKGQTDCVYFYSPSKQQYLGSLTGPEAGDDFGVGILNLGDINGDGRPDFGIGAPMAGVNGPATGSLYVFESVPEPTTLFLIMAAVPVMLKRRRKS